MNHDNEKLVRQHDMHSHTWLIGIGGLLTGSILMIYVPSLPAISASVLLFALFHVAGGIVLFASAYAMGGKRLWQRLFGRTPTGSEDYDYGWGPEWMNGLGITALACWTAAVALQIVVPAWWPAIWGLLAFGFCCLVGNFIMRAFQNRDYAILPMVALTQGDQDHILDAGCGAGRTTIALSRILRHGRITAFDRFDAHYIERGGRTLLEQNLRRAGLSDKVEIQTGDLNNLPFSDGTFSAAVSTNVFDHLGNKKLRALQEIHRTLKPGGRFLMAVWVPGWTMFAVGNVLSLFLTTRQQWRVLAQQAGFIIRDQGVCNYAWFVLLEKPVHNATEACCAGESP